VQNHHPLNKVMEKRLEEEQRRMAEAHEKEMKH